MESASMIVERLTAWHFARFAEANAELAHVRLLADVEYQSTLIAVGGFAGIGRDGVPVVLAGLIDQGGGRALAWQWTGRNLCRERFGVHRAVARYLAHAPFRRIEMHVDPRNNAAARWAIRLGFDFEAIMRRYFESGEALLFARIR
jgi:RimJ/RimL family protein N-acetyltransferase